MRLTRLLTILLCIAPSILIAGERRLLDEGWLFKRGDTPGAQKPAFDDTQWRRVDLPHDWSTEAPPVADAPSQGGGGFHQTGIGWYRMPLAIEEESPGERYRLEFEGVYQNAEVWVNGQRLGEHDYGYTPFLFNITPHLKHGAELENTIAVRVDNSEQPNSRWYSGSGIYRHVWLRRLAPVHILPESVWTEASPKGPVGDFTLYYTVVNTTDADRTIYVEEAFDDVAPQTDHPSRRRVEVGAGESIEVEQQVSLDSADPWSPDSPKLHQLQLRVFATDDTDGTPIDKVDHTFGLRSVTIDAERGLLLNGRSIEMFGGNVHHDHGPLGAASYDMAEDRKVRLLKAAGFNAVRTAHNPPSEAFLDACDRHGLLVIDEFFDGWVKSKVRRDYGPRFKPMWKENLTATMVRDRRHPCVVMWSIGNEVFERGEESGPQLAQELAASVREIDSSRPVTIGLNRVGEGKWKPLDPMFDPVDVAGYNYQSISYEPDHERLPQRVMFASESYPHDAFESFQAVQSHPYVIGDFVWSAIDYLGEAAIGRVFAPGEEPRKAWEGDHFPWRAALCGDIDLVGRRKPISRYRNIVWDRGEKLYLAVEEPTPDGGQWQLTPWSILPCQASWTWPVPEGTPLKVHAYSRYPRVRLSLNGRVVAEAQTGEEQQFQAVFDVPYEPGQLVLEGLQERRVAQQLQLATAEAAARIELAPEQDTITADRRSIVFVNVRVTDSRGITRPTEEHLIAFSVAGPAEIIAVGNADPTSRLAYTDLEWPTHQGRALVVLRSTGQVGTATFSADCDSLPASQIELNFKPK